MHYDTTIIGAGPAGLTAAIYLGRYRRKTLLVSEGIPRARWAPRIHNLIGYDRGISGPLLLRRLHRQLVRVGGVHWAEASAHIKKCRAGFEVTLSDAKGSRIVTSSTVILATGIQDIQPEIGNLEELRSIGLLRYCAICDGFEHRRAAISVLARDDAGLTRALFLGCWTRSISIIVPKKLSISRARLKQIRLAGARMIRCERFSIESLNSGRGAKILTDRGQTIRSRVVYVELGAEINDSAFKGLKQLRRTREGYLITTHEQRTSIPGLFAIGDCVNLLGQVSVAAGQAAVAATTIHNDLL